MRSWVFRNRRRLEVIYGTPGRSRPLVEPLLRRGAGDPAPGGRRRPELRLLVYEMIPAPRRPLRQAG